MKITLHNLGVIKEAEIDLKPLTIFVGPNNAGKTWLAYTLAGIFGRYGFRKYWQAYIEDEFPGAYPPLDLAVKQVINAGNAAIDLVQFAEEYAEIYFNNIAHYAQHWMPEFMSTQAASFENLNISIDLAEAKTDILKRILNYTLRSEISGGQQKPLLSIRKKRGETMLFIYTSTEYASLEHTSTEEQVSTQLPSDTVKELLVSTILQALHRSLYPDVRVLPTERTTFITFPFQRSRRMNRGLSMLKEKSPQDVKAKTMIGPVNSFLDMIQATFVEEPIEKDSRKEDAKSNPRINQYIQLAQLLEQSILSGAVNFSQSELDYTDQSNLDPSREILFQPSQNTKLEISIASSMVKELSPLVLYLRYLAKPGELLIIDEPEMNLHPEAQAKIIEFLAILANVGLNILITTHSPYVMDHLANLMKAREHADRETISKEFYLQRTDAFISKAEVAVYLVEDRQTKNALDEEGVIQWSTFGEVSDRISDIYFKL